MIKLSEIQSIVSNPNIVRVCVSDKIISMKKALDTYGDLEIININMMVCDTMVCACKPMGDQFAGRYKINTNPLPYNANTWRLGDEAYLFDVATQCPKKCRLIGHSSTSDMVTVKLADTTIDKSMIIVPLNVLFKQLP